MNITWTKIRNWLVSTFTTVRRSARWQIVGWIMVMEALVLIALGSVAHSAFVGWVSDEANERVESELKGFRNFANQEADPRSGEPFDSPGQVFDAFLSQAAPARDTAYAVIVDDAVVDNLTVEGHDVDLDVAELTAVVESRERAGIHDESDADTFHWAKLPLTGREEDGELLVLISVEQAFGEAASLIRLLAVIGVVGMALTLVTGWVVAGRILAPVRRVRMVAARVGDEDLVSRVPVTGNDEVTDLAATFNLMLDRIEQAYATQRQFLDDTSHELRTPITVIRGHLDLMDREGPEGREKSRKVITAELDRMGRIVEDLLTLARAEGVDFLKPADVPAEQLLIDVENAASMLAERRWVITDLAEGTVHVDPQRIVQAMLQYVSNAVTVTEENDVLELGSRFEEIDGTRHLSMWVKDHGPGLSEEEAEKVFDRFVRFRSSEHSKRNNSGAGLGLPIIKALVEAHGGHTWLRTREGGGATFGFNIPAAETPRDIEPVEEEEK